MDKLESDHPATGRDPATVLAWVSIAIVVSFIFSQQILYRSALLFKEGLSLHAKAWTWDFFEQYFLVIWGVSILGVVVGFVAESTLRERAATTGSPLRIPLWVSCRVGCVSIVLGFWACPYFTADHMADVVSPGVASDMRAITIAIETYHEDHGVNPPQLLPYLTTPTAYIDHVPYDPMYFEKLELYVYGTYGRRWILISAGPNGEVELDPEKDYRDQPEFSIWVKVSGGAKGYDPTNGCFSPGDFYWTMEWVNKKLEPDGTYSPL